MVKLDLPCRAIGMTEKNGLGKIFQLNMESHALLLVPDIELHSAKFIFYFTVAIVHEMGRCQ